MRVKGTWKLFLLIGIVGVVMGGGVQASSDIKLVFNHQEIETSAKPIIHAGHVYAPVTTIANALDVKWEWLNDEREFLMWGEEFIRREGGGAHQSYTPLGKGYYFYQDTGGQSIIKEGDGDEDKKKVKIPYLKVEEGVRPWFFLPETRFVDIQNDGMGNELLLQYSVGETEGKGDRMVLHLLQLKNETLHTMDIFDLGTYDSSSDQYIESHYASKAVYVDYKDCSSDESPCHIKRTDVYRWQNGQLEKAQTLTP